MEITTYYIHLPTTDHRISTGLSVVIRVELNITYTLKLEAETVSINKFAPEPVHNFDSPTAPLRLINVARAVGAPINDMGKATLKPKFELLM